MTDPLGDLFIEERAQLVEDLLTMSIDERVGYFIDAHLNVTRWSAAGMADLLVQGIEWSQVSEFHRGMMSTCNLRLPKAQDV